MKDAIYDIAIQSKQFHRFHVTVTKYIIHRTVGHKGKLNNRRDPVKNFFCSAGLCLDRTQEVLLSLTMLSSWLIQIQSGKACTLENLKGRNVSLRGNLDISLSKEFYPGTIHLLTHQWPISYQLPSGKLSEQLPPFSSQ